jgi:HPt (histidine-containing phosphotransfer) domain-containing protein
MAELRSPVATFGGAEAVFDEAHLDSQTLGDPELKGDVLALFLAQCSKLLPIIASDKRPALRLDAAHTLKGAAAAVGAWTVAARAGAVERAAHADPSSAAGEAVQALAAAIAEARAAIAQVVPDGAAGRPPRGDVTRYGKGHK